MNGQSLQGVLDSEGKNLGQQNFDPKPFWVQKGLGTKNVTQKNLDKTKLYQKIFGTINIWSKGILSKRNCAQQQLRPLQVNLGDVKFFFLFGSKFDLVQYLVP